MAKHVTIATVQFRSEWANGRTDARKVVLEELSENIAALKGSRVDLVVFSEGIGAVGQTLGEAERTTEPGPLLDAYQRLARQECCRVAGAVKLKENGRVFNAVVYYGPDGKLIGSYNKTYPTISEIEEGISPGTGAVVVDSPVGRLGSIICFDLNFETLRNQYRALRPDILVFPSMFHGGLAQAMWAYECRAFFACAWQYTGGGILDPFGCPLATNHCYHPIARTTVNLDRALIHLDYNREKFAEIERKYGEEVRIDIPSNIGRAMIYSESDRRTALDVVREFELELLDDYFERSRSQIEVCSTKI